MVTRPASTAAKIASELTGVLRRNEELRISHWYAAFETPPRPHAQDDTISTFVAMLNLLPCKLQQ